MTRTILASVCVLVCLLSTLSLAVGQAEDALVGYWPFDEGVGEDAEDGSGNGLNGVLEGEADWVVGKFDKALDFGAGGGYILVPDDDALDLTTGLTYMAWFNLNEAITGQRRMMSKNNSVFVIFDFGLPTSLDFLVKPGNDFVESTTIFETGEWYHFAGTYDGDSLRIYINGEMEGEKGGVPEIETSDLDLWLGADDWQAGTDLPGVLDEVRIYNKALSDGEIKQAMSGPVAVQMAQEKLPITWGLVKKAY